MELRLDLALSTGSGAEPDPIQDHRSTQNRSFGEAFGNNLDLPHLNSNRNGEVKEEFVVGWPPLKSWRKQLCHHNRRACATNYVNVDNTGGGGGGGRRRNSLYVKVKMEGVGIVRKIDLTIYRSYRTLAPNLVTLFGKSEENAEFKLMYQNKEGEWLHARDVPWEWFIKSVQRLKLEKNFN